MTASVDMARSELRVLVTKAARGAGLSWGLAEEAGWAADWLVGADLPAAEWAADWLAAVIDGRDDPVTVGVGLADSLGGADGPELDAAVPEGLAAPGFLLPFLHVIAIQRGPVELFAPTGRAVSVDEAGGVQFGPAWSPSPRSWGLRRARIVRNMGRARPSLSVVECLEGMALRITVPASDASRLNAGSALSDND